MKKLDALLCSDEDFLILNNDCFDELLLDPLNVSPFVDIGFPMIAG